MLVDLIQRFDGDRSKMVEGLKEDENIDRFGYQFRVVVRIGRKSNRELYVSQLYIVIGIQYYEV